MQSAFVRVHAGQTNHSRHWLKFIGGQHAHNRRLKDVRVGENAYGTVVGNVTFMGVKDAIGITWSTYIGRSVR